MQRQPSVFHCSVTCCSSSVAPTPNGAACRVSLRRWCFCRVRAVPKALTAQGKKEMHESFCMLLLRAVRNLWHSPRRRFALLAVLLHALPIFPSLALFLLPLHARPNLLTLPESGKLSERRVPACSGRPPAPASPPARSTQQRCQTYCKRFHQDRCDYSAVTVLRVRLQLQLQWSTVDLCFY